MTRVRRGGVIVLDSLALLATFFEEPGYEQVDAVLPEAMMSVVNAIEALGRLARAGQDVDLMRPGSAGPDQP